MKKSKRTVKIAGALFAGILTAAGLTGCIGGRQEPPPPVTVTVWHYYNGAQQIAFENMVSEFNDTEGKEEGIVVECHSQAGVENVLKVVLDAEAEKQGAAAMPNICSAYADTAYQMYQKDLLVDLLDYFTDEELGNYYQGFLNDGKFSEDKMMILPVAKATEVLVLNRTDWEPFAREYGLDLEALATYEGITKTAELYYEWSKGKAFFGRDAMANLFFAGAVQNGFELATEQDGKTRLHLDRDFFRKLWDNFYIPYVKGYFTKNGKFCSDDMGTGEIIAYIGSSSGADYIPDKVMVSDRRGYNIETCVLPCPVFEGGVKAAPQQGAGMVVLRSDPEKERASVAFLKWFTEESRNKEFAVAAGYLPVTAKELTSLELQQILPQDQDKRSIEMAQTAGKMLLEYKMYIPVATKDMQTIRGILEKSLLLKAQADREAGLSAQEAEQEQRFEEWYQEISEELEAAVR